MYKAEKESVQRAHSGTCTKLKKKKMYKEHILEHVQSGKRKCWRIALFF